MKNFITLTCFLVNMHLVYSQGIAELKRIRCLKNMPTTYEEVEKQDTIYILYHKSNVEGFEQNKIDVENYEGNSYYFFKYLHFPTNIFDYQGYEKVNFRKPIEMYKSKSFICKNIKRTIDVYFLKKFSYEFYTDFYDKKRITFIIDLDIKIKNKYKIRQVNNPGYIID